MQVLLENLAKQHYENFPVASYFIPKKYRKAIHLIYAYARVADDIADEGMLSAEDRIAKLNQWEVMLLDSLNGNSKNDFFKKLSEKISEFSLPPKLFQDLLIAFRQDSSNPKYETFSQLLEYCKYSANPIGRLLLRIFNSDSEENNRLSDYICTALQLTNFWQDISIDTKRNRFYIAIEDMRRFNVTERDLHQTDNAEQFRTLLQFQVERTRTFFQKGKPLLKKVHPDFRRELSLIWHGGMRILEKIAKQNYDTRFVRPKLNFFDGTMILFRSLLQ